VAIAALTFVLFCLLSGSIYLLNDVMDCAEDRRHPTKCRRPIAAGELPIPVAVATAVILAPASIVGCYFMNIPTGALALGYLLLTIAYVFVLKHVVILDVLTVSAGYVFRAAVGATAIGVVISEWLLICTILLALFLVLSKRRQELIGLEESAADHRPILGEYSSYLLDQMIAVVTASTVMSYALYTISERTVAEVGSNWLMYTVPFVIYGIFRYLYLVHQRSEGAAPDRVLLTDLPLIVNILLYGLAVMAILHFSA
jgi:4-hydroxybenzoate polyprenyltransferase